MKQVLQDLKTGRTEVADVPCPVAGRGQLLVSSTRTLLSAGTERMLVEFAKAGWIDKARQQPEKVRMVLDKVKTDGLLPTWEAVTHRLAQPMPMGYCNVGRVVEVGAGVEGYSVGDRVASNGRHAEIIVTPTNLCAKVPQNVDDDAAAFTVLGSIALQGIRLAAPTLGEAVVVTGLGLVGLLAVQLLRAHGCRVLGLDFDRSRLDFARRFGADVCDLSAGDPVAAARAFSRDRGIDAVLITASTESNEPVHQAALMCRKRGRIVLVGVAGLELVRADFYEKELTFQVSCSYGPGRYDPSYERHGFDYPVGYVRWTEQRNFEAVLDMLSDGRLNVAPLISHRFRIDQAESAYDLLGAKESSLGIVLEYPQDAVAHARTLRIAAREEGKSAAPIGNAFAISVIGAGNYATRTLIPALVKAGASLRTIVSQGGVSSVNAARKFGFAEAGTDAGRVFADEAVDVVVVATRHDSHSDMVCRALAAGKHVFVEKPLALDEGQLRAVEDAYAAATAAGRERMLMVGFNRRFSPHAQKIHALLENLPGPKTFIATVNAGAAPKEHWTLDPAVGGGRIVGEACHFIDLIRFLSGETIVSHDIRAMGGSRDTAALTLHLSGGSIGTVHYLANGSRSFPKERFEVFAGGGVLQIDNFRRLRGFGWRGFGSMNLWRQDKGQDACSRAFVRAVQTGGPAPIPFPELVEVSRIAIAAEEAIRA